MANTQEPGITKIEGAKCIIATNKRMEKLKYLRNACMDFQSKLEEADLSFRPTSTFCPNNIFSLRIRLQQW